MRSQPSFRLVLSGAVSFILFAVGCGSSPPVAKADPAKVETPKTDPAKTPAEKGAETPAAAGAIDPLAYARKTTYFVASLDAVSLEKTPLFQKLKNLKPEQLSGAPGNLENDLPELVKNAPSWESVTVFLGPEEPETFIPMSVLTVFRSKGDRAKYLEEEKKNLSEKVEKGTFEGVTYYKHTNFLSTECRCELGDRAWYVGSEAGLKEVLAAKGAVQNAALAGLLKPLLGKGQLVAALNVDPVRQHLIELGQQMNEGPQITTKGEAPPKREPAPAGPFTQIPEWTKTATVAIDLSGGTLADLRITATSEDNAAQLFGFFKSSWGMGVGMLSQMKAKLGPLPEEHPYKRMHGVLDELTKSQFNQNGSVVTATIPRPANLDKVPEILEAIEVAEKEAQKANYAKYLGLAVVTALSVYRDDPEKLTLRSKEGKPLYSWRVTILPYLEQAALYNGIDFAQPWDSEKGRELLKTEIDMYKTSAAKEPGTTTWKLVPKLQGGVMLVEGGEGSAVPWTQPDEVKVDGDNPLVSFGKEPAGGYTVVMSDGIVKKLSSDELKKQLLEKPE